MGNLGRIFVFVCLISCLIFVASCVSFQSDEEISRINNFPLGLWKAKKYEQFENMTLEQFQHQYLLQDPKYFELDQPVVTESELHMLKENEQKRRQKLDAIPDSFDSRVQWEHLSCRAIMYVQDQGQCGSCWAFSASESLGARFCIATNATVNKLMSAQDLVTCDHLNFGCKGGIPFLAYHYMEHTGVVDFECMPYMIGHYSFCPSHCMGTHDTMKSHKYHLKTYTHIKYDVDMIEQDIMKNGPVSADFTVYSDFMNYNRGVYQHTTGGALGGHAILIVGWGVDETSNLPYWIVQNSWGKLWGIHGYFWMLKGRNECGIEKDIYSGIPDKSRIPASALN